jgi:hypothetical protein
MAASLLQLAVTSAEIYCKNVMALTELQLHLPSPPPWPPHLLLPLLLLLLLCPVL